MADLSKIVDELFMMRVRPTNLLDERIRLYYNGERLSTMEMSGLNAGRYECLLVHPVMARPKQAISDADNKDNRGKLINWINNNGRVTYRSDYDALMADNIQDAATNFDPKMFLQKCIEYTLKNPFIERTTEVLISPYEWPHITLRVANNNSDLDDALERFYGNDTAEIMPYIQRAKDRINIYLHTYNFYATESYVTIQDLCDADIRQILDNYFAIYKFATKNQAKLFKGCPQYKRGAIADVCKYLSLPPTYAMYANGKMPTPKKVRISKDITTSLGNPKNELQLTLPFEDVQHVSNVSTITDSMAKGIMILSLLYYRNCCGTNQSATIGGKIYSCPRINTSYREIAELLHPNTKIGTQQKNNAISIIQELDEKTIIFRYTAMGEDGKRHPYSTVIKPIIAKTNQLDGDSLILDINPVFGNIDERWYDNTTIDHLERLRIASGRKTRNTTGLEVRLEAAIKCRRNRGSASTKIPIDTLINIIKETSKNDYSKNQLRSRLCDELLVLEKEGSVIKEHKIVGEFVVVWYV